MPQYVSILRIIPQTYFKSMTSEHYRSFPYRIDHSFVRELRRDTLFQYPCVSLLAVRMGPLLSPSP